MHYHIYFVERLGTPAWYVYTYDVLLYSNELAKAAQGGHEF
jgi:hypothetical protein